MLFKRDATGFLTLLLLVALLSRQGTLALLLGLVLLAVAVARGWSALVLRNVSYRRTVVPDRAFVGDQVRLEVELRNPKLIGVPSLRVQDVVPARIEVAGATLIPHTQPGAQLLRRFTSLRPFEALRYQVALTCPERGCYFFGPVYLEATDPWGLFANEAQITQRTPLIVYPKLLGLGEIGFNPRHPLGDDRAPRQLLTDPSRTVGVRDYQRDDPLKAIHWGATARRGELQTRVYEPATSRELAILLDVDTFQQYWEGIQPELAERMISVAATVATVANGERWSFGLYANCATVNGSQLVRMPPSRSPGQLPYVLETLAKLVPFSLTPMPQLLRRLSPHLPWGTTLLLISAVPSEALQQSLLRLVEHGRQVIWLYCGSEEPPRLRGVDLRRVVADARWRAPAVASRWARPLSEGAPGRATIGGRSV